MSELSTAYILEGTSISEPALFVKEFIESRLSTQSLNDIQKSDTFISLKTILAQRINKATNGKVTEKEVIQSEIEIIPSIPLTATLSAATRLISGPPRFRLSRNLSKRIEEAIEQTSKEQTTTNNTDQQNLANSFKSRNHQTNKPSDELERQILSLSARIIELEAFVKEQSNKIQQLETLPHQIRELKEQNQHLLNRISVLEQQSTTKDNR